MVTRGSSAGICTNVELCSLAKSGLTRTITLTFEESMACQVGREDGEVNIAPADWHDGSGGGSRFSLSGVCRTIADKR